MLETGGMLKMLKSETQNFNISREMFKMLKMLIVFFLSENSEAGGLPDPPKKEKL